MKYPFIKQHDEKDCGAACLSMISEYYGLKLPLAKFREAIKVDNQGANIYGILKGASQLGLNCDALTGEAEELENGIKSGEIKFPFIARITNPLGYEHYIVIYGEKNNKYIIGDPATSKVFKTSKEDFYQHWKKQIVVFEPSEKFEKGNERKGTLSKYFKLLTSQKKLLTFVFVASLVISLANVFSSVVFQYVLVASDSAFGEMETEVDECDECHEEEHSHEEHEHSHEEPDIGMNKYSSTLNIYQQANGKLEVIFRNISTVCISIICLYLFSCILNIIRGLLLAKAAKRVDVPITMRYYKKLMNLPSSMFSTMKTGELMSRLNDAGKIRNAVSAATITIMLDSIMAIGCGLLLIYISYQLFIITAVIVVLYLVIVLAFRRPIRIVNNQIMEKSASFTSYIKESIDGIETVKINQIEDDACEKTHELFDDYANSSVKGSIIYTTQESLVSVVSSIGIILLLWLGTNLCVKNIISIADLFIYYYLISYFFNPIKNLINIQPELQTAITAADRLNDILCATAEDKESGKEKLEHIDNIEIKGLSFRYGNRRPVLQDININIPHGKKIALVGESGCGKTTIARLLMRFYDVEYGNIIINGKDISNYSINDIRKKIAYISQDVYIFADSLFNNLIMGDENITREEVERVCHLCGIDSFINELPMGLDTMLEENGGNLSTGQKQRLAIVRAILRKPEFLIMDEATSNLDTMTERSIEAALEKICEGMSCLIIAHRLKTIKSCDYIYVMDKRNIIEEGSHETLINQNGLYKKLYSY